MTTATRPRCRFYTATSLDGFLATDDDSLQWLFEQEHDPDGPGGEDVAMDGVGALVMGASTYSWVVDHLAQSGEAWPYDAPTFVFTHRELPPVAESVQMVCGEPVDVWPQIAATTGDGVVWVVGGGQLAADFATAGLLDEVLVSIASVTLGSGKPLFGGAFDLSLRDVERNGAFIVARYDVLGERA